MSRKPPKDDDDEAKEIRVMLLDGNRRLLRSIKEYLQQHKMHITFVNQCDACDEDIILIVLGNVTLPEMRKKLVPSRREKAIVVIKPAKIWGLARDEKLARRLEQQIRDIGYGFVAIGNSNEELAAFVLNEIQERT